MTNWTCQHDKCCWNHWQRLHRSTIEKRWRRHWNKSSLVHNRQYTKKDYKGIKKYLRMTSDGVRKQQRHRPDQRVPIGMTNALLLTCHGNKRLLKLQGQRLLIGRGSRLIDRKSTLFHSRTLVVGDHSWESLKHGRHQQSAQLVVNRKKTMQAIDQISTGHTRDTYFKNRNPFFSIKYFEIVGLIFRSQSL